MANMALQSVGFIRTDGKPTSGLVSVKKSIAKKLPVDEQATIYEAKSFKYIDFVFFRRFSDGRSSQVAAYVVDNSDDKLDKKTTLPELHRQVWLQGTTPLLYIAGASQIDILACAREPDFWDKTKQECKYNPAKTFNKDLLTTAGQISDEIKKFSALKLADGTFWDDPDNRKLANHDKAAHQSLIQAIVEADKKIDGENYPLQRRLLLLMVLIKYLEDRGVFKDGVWFGRFHKGARRFLDVLKSGEPEKVHRLLRALARKFNGEVFDISCLGKHELTKKVLRTFARIVEARTLKNQQYLWEQYSFEHLPVEIISHLYQRFIKDGHGTVYTPPFLSALLLDHTIPYKKMNGKERILDPACGSGVFLVGAFKRLINLWRSENNWKNPTVEKLKETLGKSIYGVDLDRNAIDLTAFSLSLAICDALRPNVIWKELKFDYLRGSNLFETDFFKLLLDSRNNDQNILDKKFDIVIGNPPFESELTEAEEKVDQVAQQQDNSRGLLPDKQTAYLFLEQALTVLKPNSGRVCLIQPAGFLYNRNINTFRTNIFQKCQIDTIFDFTSIRKLYEADPKTVAVFAHAGKHTVGHWIAHWTFRRTVSVKERICFELDHYDRHRISQEQAESDPYIWRANLLGGGRLGEISKRIRAMRTLAKYLDEKNDWDYGEGFIAAKTGKREPAPFLTGKPLLPTKAFTESGIDETQIGTVTETHFRSAYTEERYSAPIVLIKALDSLPVAFLDKGFLAYRDKTVGIHAPRNQVAKLRSLYETLRSNHDIYRFCCTLNGSQLLVGKATAILKQDIDLLPYPKNHKDLKLSFWEKALQNDVLKYMADYIRLGQNSQLLRKKAKESDVENYSKMFCQMLGSVYDNLKSSTPIIWDNLICQPFYFGDYPELTWLDSDAEANLEKLIYYKNHERLRTVKVVRFYDKNVLLIVKPDRLRFWISSTAIRDADDTLTHLYQQGY
jgi:methylase of polypeptide subunit release factors